MQHANLPYCDSSSPQLHLLQLLPDCACVITSRKRQLKQT